MSEAPDELYAMRHSLAHILATAIQRLWPKAKFGVGPVVENGFYYDVDLGKEKISEEQFKQIEEEMRKVIKADYPFEKYSLPIADALTWSTEADQPYKSELLHDLMRSGTTLVNDLDPIELGTFSGGEPRVKDVTFYRDGEFTDLCRGPHVPSTKQVGAFKLLRVSGAYWRGNEKNAQMQRIYGAAFKTKEELQQYLLMLEEARKRDHRKLGFELDLFVFSDLVGPGLPLFTPRGTIIRETIGAFSQELQAAAGYERVAIPHMARIELYKTSGHYEKYPERFSVTSHESDDEFMMKPMNCPHHTQIYASRPRSYRDLPIRYMENTVVYRDEKAGELHGLSRVRAATQDDAHVFCRFDQLEQEFAAIMVMIRDMYQVFGLSWRARLSFRDNTDKYLGDIKQWETAEGMLEKVMKDLEVEYFIGRGEAAFYGPKVDIMATDALGREWQLATEQLDFVQPERFKLEYTNEEGSQERPVMIHKALLGSIERFMSVYIEHTAGRFPVWMSPEQLRILTINQEEATVNFAESVVDLAVKQGVRTTLDNSKESVGKKIRNAELMKVPYTVVIGAQEITSNAVIPRIRKDMEVQPRTAPLSIHEFLKTISNEAQLRTSKSSL